MAEAFTDRSTRIPEPLAFEERYEVVGLERPTPTIVELWLRPLGEVLDYLPGEYVLLEDRERTVPPRSFSIANAPRPDGLISLLATRVAGGHNSAWIHERLRVGQEVSVSGPYGTFVEDPAATDPAVFLAAGSGLAPIRALLEAGLATHSRSSLTLIFSARSEADVIDRERFQAWQSEHPSFRFIRTLTRGAGPPPYGRIPALLPTLQGSLHDHDVFIAGAPAFVLACAAAADALGASRARVHTEVFFVEPQPWSGSAPQAEERT
jgi:CDP-4-dehydro-6-deoxyglucose reductase, E3